jgi:hypothetical protein
MRRLFICIVLASFGACATAQAQSAPDPATVHALNGAAFSPRAPAHDAGDSVGRTVGFGPKRSLYLYAGASNDAQQLQEDPRWQSSNDTRSANSLVNTRFGIGWQRDSTRVSLGYLRRQLPNPGGDLRAAPHRDSMVGLSVSMHAF